MAGVAGAVLLPRFFVRYDLLSAAVVSFKFSGETGVLSGDSCATSIHLNFEVLFRFSVPGPTKLFLRI